MEGEVEVVDEGGGDGGYTVDILVLCVALSNV